MIPSFITQFQKSHLFYFDKTEVTEYLGRSIKKIGSSALTVAKTIGVFGLIVGLSLFPVLPVIGCSCLHNSTHSIAAIPPPLIVFDPPTFPAYTAWFMNPGLQLARNGTTACNIGPCLEPKINCEQITTAVVTDLESRKIFDTIEQGTTFRQKGIVGTNQKVNNVLRTLHFRINNRRFANYEKALHYVEQTIFTCPEAFLTHVEDIISTIKTLHAILTNDLPDQQTITPGKFRTTEKILSNLAATNDVLTHVKSILSSQDYELFEPSYHRFISSNSVNTFTDSERKLWSKCFIIPTAPTKVKAELTAFAQDLIVRLRRDFSESTPVILNRKQASIELASFVHTELIRIHPFLIANGRLARILMNTVLHYFGGYDPVIIDNEGNYKKAVAQSMHTPQAFTDYLANHLIPWTQAQAQVLSRDNEYTTLYRSML